jgi:hypothetical protein
MTLHSFSSQRPRRQGGRVATRGAFLVAALTLSMACGDDKPKPRPEDPPGPDASTPDAGPPPAEDAGSDASEGGDDQDSGPPDGGIKPPPVDCENIPAAPVPYELVTGPQAAEDFTFDSRGNLWSVDASGNITTTAFGDKPKLRVPGIASSFVSGTRLLEGGDLIINDSEKNQVLRVSPTGSKVVLATGLSYPNGLAIGMDGWAYVAEQSANRVVRVNPDNKKLEVVAENIEAANGLSFSPDYKALYVGGFGTGKITKVDVLGDGKFGEPTVYAENLGGGGLDGMGVDACGNVYVCEYVAAVLWRIRPDGTKEKVVDLSKYTDWIPNMNWGVGEGWDKDTLFVSDRSVNHVYAVKLGVPGKKEPHLK